MLTIEAHASSKRALLCGFALSVAQDWLSSRVQALEQLREILPSVISDALGKAGGNVQAADLLFKATQERPAGTVGTMRASLRQPTDVVRRQCAVGTHMYTHGRT